VKNFWLVKQEPSAYSWDDLVRDGRTSWTGVRNFGARNNLRAMSKGDEVLFYHSVVGKAVVGVARVEREAYVDPTAEEGSWSAVDLVPFKPLKNPVTLEMIKVNPALSGMALVRRPRLSVQPVAPDEFRTVISMGA
jgi:predicted RNA-binding protein with PUA-like domain